MEITCLVTSLSPLQHQNVSTAALAAVKRDVLIAGVRVEPADALFIGKEGGWRGVTEWGLGRFV